MPRLKLRLVNEQTGAMHNDNSSAMEELEEKVARRCALSSGFQLITQCKGRSLVLNGDEGWKVLTSLYQEGCQQQQLGAATYRVRVLVRPTPAAGSASPLQEQQPGIKPSRRPRSSLQQDAPKRVCQRKSKNDLSNSVAVGPSQEEVPLGGHVSSKHQSPLAAAAANGASWDEQVLQSIKRTVTKLHFGSRLAPQPPPA